MKTLFKYLTILIFGLYLNTGFSQAPPPPNNDETGSSGGSVVVGGGAPIGGGIIILVSVALAYGYIRYYLKKPDYTVEEES